MTIIQTTGAALALRILASARPRTAMSFPTACIAALEPFAAYYTRQLYALPPHLRALRHFLQRVQRWLLRQDRHLLISTHPVPQHLLCQAKGHPNGMPFYLAYMHKGFERAEQENAPVTRFPAPRFRGRPPNEVWNAREAMPMPENQIPPSPAQKRNPPSIGFRLDSGDRFVALFCLRLFNFVSKRSDGLFDVS